jgi:hypothetical protein
MIQLLLRIWLWILLLRLVARYKVDVEDMLPVDTDFDSYRSGDNSLVAELPDSGAWEAYLNNVSVPEFMEVVNLSNFRWDFTLPSRTCLVLNC